MEINDRYFCAAYMNIRAKNKPNRDAEKERANIIHAICNEANNGNYSYRRNHLFPQNVEYLREKGFKVTLLAPNQYEVRWDI
jgi:hypothetical protein